MKGETPVVIEEVISVDFNVVGTLNSQWWCFGCLTKRSLKSICLFPLNTHMCSTLKRRENVSMSF